MNRTLRPSVNKDDSYIFYNIGYHLFKSEQVDLFPKIYLDLNFVESMLKATSSVDLLNDYKRYGEQIIGRVSPLLWIPKYLEFDFKSVFSHSYFDS